MECQRSILLHLLSHLLCLCTFVHIAITQINYTLFQYQNPYCFMLQQWQMKVIIWGRGSVYHFHLNATVTGCLIVLLEYIDPFSLCKSFLLILYLFCRQLHMYYNMSQLDYSLFCPMAGSAAYVLLQYTARWIHAELNLAIVLRAETNTQIVRIFTQ